MYLKIQIMNNKGRLRNSQRPEETKETWQQNAVWYPGCGTLEQKKDISGEFSEIKVWSLIVMYQCQGRGVRGGEMYNAVVCLSLQLFYTSKIIPE